MNSNSNLIGIGVHPTPTQIELRHLVHQTYEKQNKIKITWSNSKGFKSLRPFSRCNMVQQVFLTRTTFLEALEIAHSMSIPQLIIKRDSNCVVNAFNSSTNMLNELGGVVCKCCLILKDNTDYKVVFFRGQVNKIAHSLTKMYFPLRDYMMYCYFFIVQSPINSVLFSKTFSSRKLLLIGQ